MASIEATQTICEMRKSNNGQREAICFPKRGHPEKISVEGAKGLDELKKRIKEKDSDEESPYERIEIYMPFKMLEVWL